MSELICLGFLETSVTTPLEGFNNLMNGHSILL